MQGFFAILKTAKKLKIDAWKRIAWWVGLSACGILMSVSQSSNDFKLNMLTVGFSALTAFMILAVPFAIGEIVAKSAAFDQALFERHKYNLPIPSNWDSEIQNLERVVFDPNVDMQIKIIVGWVAAATFLAPQFLYPTLENLTLVCLPIGANIWLYHVHFNYLVRSEREKLNFEAEKEINDDDEVERSRLR